MIEILRTLKDTPLPSILVIGGIVFLLLSFVRRFGSDIELDPKTKVLVGFIGIILLCTGTGLYIIPGIQPPPANIATQTPFSIVVTATSNPIPLANPTATAMPSLPTLQQPTIGGLGCASIPANPQDGVEVQLNSSQWYMIEEYDNQSSPPTHIFRAQLGNISVTANATSGSRAWECPNESEAFLQAQISAAGYKQSNPPHKVIGPDGQEVK